MRGLAAFLALLLAVAASAQGPRTMTKKGVRPSRPSDNPDFGLPSGKDVPDGRRMGPPAVAPPAGKPALPAGGPAPGAAAPPPPAGRPAPMAAAPPPAGRPAPMAAAPPPPAGRPAPMAAAPPPPAGRPAPMAGAPPPPAGPRRGDNTDRGLPSGKDVPDGRRLPPPAAPKPPMAPAAPRAVPPPAAPKPAAGLPPTRTKKGRRPSRFNAPAYNVVPAGGAAASRPAPPAPKRTPMYANPWATFFNPLPPAPQAPLAPLDPMVPGLSCEESCPYSWSPVCSVYGNTYDNKCRLTCSGEPYSCEGQCPCEEPKSAGPLPSDPYPMGGFLIGTPCNCNPYEYEPVCTDDGDPYNNQCLAQCEGKTIACSSHCPC